MTSVKKTIEQIFNALVFSFNLQFEMSMLTSHFRFHWFARFLTYKAGNSSCKVAENSHHLLKEEEGKQKHVHGLELVLKHCTKAAESITKEKLLE